MARQKFVAGNWKMYTNAASARDLARAVVTGSGQTGVRVGLFPPFPYLAAVAEVVHGSAVLLGGQNLYPAVEGAFTGEVSPAMLRDVGCQWVIVGHSERRHGLGESDEFVNRKVRSGLDAGLNVILCVGETLAERECDQTEGVLDRQLAAGLAGVERRDIGRVVIAYEPVWAIGTGRNATPQQAQDAHAFIRGRVADAFGPAAAEDLIIQYGGSAKPDNAASLLSQPDVDGALVGGASLKPELFLAVVELAG